jgi:hypothetical protein
MSDLAVLAALGIGFGYLAWDTYGRGEVEYVRSMVDGRQYLVQSRPDKQQAANLLAKIRANLELLVDHLAKITSEDQRTKRILKRFNPENISEGADNAKYTSYSVNKGEKVVFCLRSRDQNKQLVDINTMMFVALHEMAHICTESVGHTPEFWDNFRWLLEESMDIGIYRDGDYKNNPVEYCGIKITNSPIEKGRT